MDEQGAVFGTLTSAQTLARLISYAVANLLLGSVSTAAPYWWSSGIDLLALAIAGGASRRLLARLSHPAGSFTESEKSRSR